MPSRFDEAFTQVQPLVADFDANEAHYLSPAYQEWKVEEMSPPKAPLAHCEPAKREADIERRDRLLVGARKFNEGMQTVMTEALKGDGEAIQDLATQAMWATMPSSDTPDKILRYETTLERQLYRAMHQLERLQRMRKGENVPAPLTMELWPRC